MTWELILDIVAVGCMVVGCLMSLAAAVGLVRFPDLLSRMHAGTKPQVFGLLLLLTAVAIEGRDPAMIPLLILAWLFMLLTVPVSAHMVGRSSYRTKHVLDETLIADDLAEALDEADTAESQGGADRPS